MAKRNSKRRPWTTSEVRELKSAARKKTPARKIARSFKRSEGATRQKAFSLGLSLDSRGGTNTPELSCQAYSLGLSSKLRKHETSTEELANCVDVAPKRSPGIFAEAEVLPNIDWSRLAYAGPQSDSEKRREAVGAGRLDTGFAFAPKHALAEYLRSRPDTTVATFRNLSPVPLRLTDPSHRQQRERLKDGLKIYRLDVSRSEAGCAQTFAEIRIRAVELDAGHCFAGVALRLRLTPPKSAAPGEVLRLTSRPRKTAGHRWR